MIGEGTRQFDLYDFFSIFIPGATVLLGLVPFIPHDTNIPAIAFVGVVIVGGLVLGRGIHGIRIFVENRTPIASHRDFFEREVADPVNIDERLVKRYYIAATDAFDEVDFPDWDDRDTNREQTAAYYSTLYTLTRAAIHMDSRGRSRTFQAIYDFYGSILVASVIIAAVYVTYTILQFQPFSSPDYISYTPYIDTLGIHPLVLFFMVIFMLTAAILISREMRSPFRKSYAQYLMADFILLQNPSDSTDK